MVLSCRLCLTENPEEKLKNVYQCRVKHSQDSLVDVLFWVFSVEVEVTDLFSKNICSKCIQLIEYILKVKNTFQKNQKSLRNHQHNPSYDSLDVQTLHDDTFKKVSNNVKRLSFCSTTPKGPHKSRYDSTNIYDRSSPRLRVSLSHIEILRPMRINLVPLENTQEYLKYRRLKNGSFKKRKFRHFNLDGALLDDICNTLKENKRDKTGPLKKDIGVSTEYTLLSKATNTDSKLCTWTRNTASLKSFMVDTPSKNFIINDKRKKRCDDTVQDDDILDIIDVSKNINFDETMTFKKDASTNTETTKPNTRNIGINATETFTKQFKRNDDLIKVNIESLVNFAPKVVLTPLEDILKDANYTQIDNFRYIKNDEPSSDSKTEEVLEQNDESSSDSNTEEVLEQNDECNIDENRQHAATNKKQRFLDYYKNFSSFAVRELIAGKKIRETYSETSAVYKIANVCSVFVCDFCSRSFLCKISLDFHYKKAHKSKKRLNGVEVDLKDSTSSTIRHKKKSKTIEERQGKPSDERSEVVKEDNVAKISCATAAKRKTKSHNSQNGESKLTCLRKKAQKINYNINYIMKHKTRAKQIPLKVKGKRGRKKKLKQLGNPVLCHEERKTISYAWDRNGLGKYSAISYYTNFSTDNTDPSLDLIERDIEHKRDLALNDTIHKLANRLDRSDVEIDVCN